MIRDYLVAFDGFEFECVDKGFEDNEEIEVVLRPEDLDIVDPGQAKIRGIVRNITFKGVHYEILIETETSYLYGSYHRLCGSRKGSGTEIRA